MMVQQNQNAIVSTLFLNKSPLSIWITYYYYIYIYIYTCVYVCVVTLFS